MGVALKGDDSAILYIDPCLSDIAPSASTPRFPARLSAPVEPGDVTNATYVLCSHEHADHTDPLTLAR